MKIYQLYIYAITTYFYELGLSRLGFEYPTFRMRCGHFNPLPHRRGGTCFKLRC